MVTKEVEVVFEELKQMLGGAVVVFYKTLGFGQGTEGDRRGRGGDGRDEALGVSVLERSEITEIELDLFTITYTNGWEISHVGSGFDSFKGYS